LDPKVINFGKNRTIRGHFSRFNGNTQTLEWVTNPFNFVAG
jgi:hypothetical protein